MARNTVSSPATVPTRAGISMLSMALEAACASPGSVFKTIKFIAVSQDMTPSRKILRSLSLCSGELAWLGTL